MIVRLVLATCMDPGSTPGISTNYLILEDYHMKITKERLTRIIKEEISNVLNISESSGYVYNKRVKDAMTREIIFLSRDLS